MGIAVLKNGFLAAYAVHTLKNGGHPHDVVDQARSIVLSLLAEFNPSVVAVERPLLYPTKRAALVSVIGEEMMARIRERGVQVVEVSPREVRRVLVGDEHATKIDVARRIVELGFTELQRFLPTPPRRSALGLRPRDRYWLHAFDALAIALTIHQHLIHRTDHRANVSVSPA
jgi:Holliday junction resolvasome RuvABC endonuclease subunit